MFFDKLVRNIVIFLIGFVLAINIYYWVIAIQVGTQDQVNYVGFYTFFKNFETMPRFETFVDSIQDFANIFADWSAWKTVLSIITLGIVQLVQFTWYVSKAIICLVIDLFRILAWLFGFLGITIDAPTV